MASVARSEAPFPSQPGIQRTPSVFRWLNLPRLFTLAILIALLIPAIQPVTDPDFWWHLTTGNWILAHQSVPRYGLFTFTTADHRWITHEWLSEVIVAALYAVGRLPLVSLVLGMVTWAGFLLVYRAIDRKVNYLVAGLALALGVAAANPIWGPRIQMITFTLTALTYLWIKAFCEGRSRALYALPLVVMLWANLHAGFVIVYAFLGIALVSEGAKLLLHRPDAIPAARIRALGVVGALSLLAALVNPSGWDLYLYALQTQGSGIQQKLIVEWFSPNFQMSQMLFFEAMIFLILVLAAFARRIEPRQFLYLLLGLGLALHSVRHLTFFVIVAVPVLADLAMQAWARRPLALQGPSGNAFTFAVNSVLLILLFAIALVAVGPSLTQRVDGKLVTRDFPVQAANFLVAHPAPGHMLNAYGWGGYLVFRLSNQQPAQPVFIFGDAALSGDRLLQDYADLQYLAPDQARLLDRYGINWIIFHSNDAIVTELRQNPSWFELHTFGDATIMMRDTPDNRTYAAASLG